MIPARPSLITKQVAEGFLASIENQHHVRLEGRAPHKPQEEAAFRSACCILPLLYTAPVVLRKAGPHLAVCFDERRTLVRVRITFLFLPVCAAFLVLTLSACSFSASSASISSAKMATDEDGKNPTETFSPNEPFYCIVELSNAPN